MSIGSMPSTAPRSQTSGAGAFSMSLLPGSQDYTVAAIRSVALPSVPAPEYRPQLATLVKEPPSGDRWLHEIKFDGYRIGCRIRDGRVTLISRTGKDWTHAFP